MPLLFRFLVYNLLPGLVSGALLWLLVNAAIALLHIRHGALRLPLLYAPLVKSILVTLGIGLVFPWPWPFLAAWHNEALATESILPFYLLWAGSALLAGYWLARRARQRVLHGALPARQVDARLESALDRVMAGYQNQPARLVGDSWICCRTGVPLPRPELWVSDKLDTPLVVTDRDEPVLVFPAELSEQMEAAELEMVLAHEIAHLTLQRPICCAAFAVDRFSLANPVAVLLAARLRHEEEKACDDLAVTLLEMPEVYAQVLLKSYRFANNRSRPTKWIRLKSTFRLLGAKSSITERVERLLGRQAPGNNLNLQRCATCLLWVGVAILLG
jgi:hypothetical protein